jgi:hypothetical protein
MDDIGTLGVVMDIYEPPIIRHAIASLVARYKG